MVNVHNNFRHPRGGSMIKKVFLSLKATFLQRALLIAIGIVSILVPGAKAAIDETMPATIPSEILADWKAQGGTAERN